VQHNEYESKLLLGWDIHQWAVAIARVGIGGTQMKYADRTRREYLSRFGQNPLELRLIGVQAEGNYDLAAALFEQLDPSLETYVESTELDSSYGDHARDDWEYSEGRKNVWNRGV
jgi:hypothetical protein